MENIKYLIENFYNKNIQLSMTVIIKILKNIVNKNKKVLIFGLGNDSLLWYKANQEKNILFVENKLFYIKKNQNINKKHIIKYDYKDITVQKSLDNLVDVKKYRIPNKLINQKPFDIILIDGPEGFSPDSHGRELPFYWSKKLMHEKTKIFIDDFNRDLEKKLFHKYFGKFEHNYFPERNGFACVFL